MAIKVRDLKFLRHKITKHADSTFKVITYGYDLWGIKFIHPPLAFCEEIRDQIRVVLERIE